MQGAKDQVPGFGCAHGELNGCQVAHFTDEYDIRIFPQRRPQSRSETFSVLADLALIHQRHLVLMDKLQRILKGQDMLLAGRVDQVDHAGQRRGFSGTGRPGYQNHPLFEVGHAPHAFGKPQLVSRKNFGGYDTENGGNPAILHHYIAAEARQTGHLIGKIQILGLFKVSLLLFAEYFVQNRFQLIMAQRFEVKAHHFAPLAEYWRIAG